MNTDIVWGYHSDPKPLSWAEFLRAWECACVDAWDAGKQEPTVTLPFNVFPHLTSLNNACTGNYIPITRISPFSWDTSRCGCDRAKKSGETVT